ncbi:MAG: trypsin-like peptidase domain-containing protein [Planctomyces sp.]|nr:trypsin-like peptidase domain-containing protein [Planctomyces sp.]
MSGALKRATLSLVALAIGISSVVAAENRETPLVKAVQQCRKSVVNIHTEKTAADDKEARFFSSKSRKITGMGTGIVVDERGYIVTNYHVIQDVDRIIATLDSGATFDARPVSFDRKQDLAIIRIEASEPLPVMPMGTSSDLMLAETVFAVGNAFGYEHTITSGIVSALHRDVEVDETQSYENLIQTDASINPGNSGGPLLNLDGEVIGINVAIRAGAQRIGFAIPIDDARRSIARLMSVERLNGIPHGLNTTDVKTPTEKKLLVDAVSPGSAAEKCGLQPGDVIRSVRGVQIQDGTDLERSLLDLPIGKVVDVVLQRDGREQTLQYTVGVGRPASQNGIVAAPRNSSPDTRTVSSSSAPPVVADGELPVIGESAVADVSPSVQLPEAADPILGKAWELLGIRLDTLNTQEQSLLRGRYKGGMKVAQVRNDSLASRYGIRSGDVLVGLDGYETLGPDNLRFILDERQLKSLTVLSYQILRGGSQTMVGSIDLKGTKK